MSQKRDQLKGYDEYTLPWKIYDFIYKQTKADVKEQLPKEEYIIQLVLRLNMIKERLKNLENKNGTFNRWEASIKSPNKFINSAIMILYELRRILINQEMKFQLGVLNKENKMVYEKTFSQLEVFEQLQKEKVKYTEVLMELFNQLQTTDLGQANNNFTEILNKAGLGQYEVTWSEMSSALYSDSLPLSFKKYIQKWYYDEDKSFRYNFKFYGPSNKQQVSENLRRISYMIKKEKEERESNIYTLYQINNDLLKFYNRGWLYEWYKKKEFDYNTQLPDTALHNIISENGPDNIPALEAGDYEDKYNVAIQAKFNNKGIIQNAQIITKADAILDTLSKLLSGEKEAEAVLQDVETIFVNRGTEANPLNQGFNNTVKNSLRETLSKLTEKTNNVIIK